MEAGESFDIWVKGSYSDGTKKDVTSLCSVSSSNTSILAVNGCTITALKAGNAQILLTLPEGRTVSKTISVVSASEEKEPLWISFDQPEYTCYVDVPADEYHSTPFTLHYGNCFNLNGAASSKNRLMLHRCLRIGIPLAARRSARPAEGQEISVQILCKQHI